MNGSTTGRVRDVPVRVVRHHVPVWSVARKVRQYRADKIRKSSPAGLLGTSFRVGSCSCGNDTTMTALSVMVAGAAIGTV